MAINQYKEGKGVNDHKKGNRTDSKRETKHLVGANKRYGEDVAYYKEIAEKIRQGKKHKQEDVLRVYKQIAEYIRSQADSEKPLTVSGIIRSSGLSKSTFYEYLGGSADYQLYQLIDLYNIDTDNVECYIDGIPVATITVDGNNVDVMLIEWSEMLQKAMLLVEEMTEERLYMKGRVGDIFSLKSAFGWQEESNPHTVNQTLVISSPEQAREAIRLLK